MHILRFQFQKTGDMAVGQVSFHNDKKVCLPFFSSATFFKPIFRSNEVRVIPLGEADSVFMSTL